MAFRIRLPRFGEIKQVACARSLKTGDVVRASSGNWPQWDHPIGGQGRWAVFVRKAALGFVVRPLLSDSTTGEEVATPEVMHLEDVETEIALAQYRRTRASR